MGNSPWLASPVNFPTGFYHNFLLPCWEEDDERDRNSIASCKSGKRVADENVVNDKSAEEPVDKDYANALQFHFVGSGRRVAAVRKFLIDVVLPDSSSPADVPKLRASLHGLSGIQKHSLPELIRC